MLRETGRGAVFFFCALDSTYARIGVQLFRVQGLWFRVKGDGATLGFPAKQATIFQNIKIDFYLVVLYIGNVRGH